jgi:peptide/nickel transport system permease protein
MTAFRAEADVNAAVAREAADALAAKPRTVWRDAWGKIRHDWAALTCAAILALYVIIAIIGFTGLLDQPIARTIGASNEAPSLKSLALSCGTDFLGRSVFWRLLYGARVAMTVAVLASVISTVIGTALGLIAGYFGRWVDNLIIWLFSTVSSIPWILLMMALAFVLKGRELNLHWLGIQNPVSLTGLPAIILALGLTSWVGLCRYVRAEVLKIRERDYVSAARALGVSDAVILFRHILPNVFHLVLIDFSLSLSAFVQAEVVLSFLGLGVMNQPSWGRMIDDAKLELLKGVWWQMVAATVAIFVFSLAVNVFGDALRDALDPKLRGVD